MFWGWVKINLLGLKPLSPGFLLSLKNKEESGETYDLNFILG